MERCVICKKKVNIMCFVCKFCECKFCCQHQLPEVHNCNMKASEHYVEYRKQNMVVEYKPESKVTKI